MTALQAQQLNMLRIALCTAVRRLAEADKGNRYALEMLRQEVEEAEREWYRVLRECVK